MTAPWWSRPGMLPIPVRFEPAPGSVRAAHAAALRAEWQQQEAEAREYAARQEEGQAVSRHVPFTDDGVTYCGWYAGPGRITDGCGESWPCSTVRGRADASLAPALAAQEES